VLAITQNVNAQHPAGTGLDLIPETLCVAVGDTIDSQQDVACSQDRLALIGFWIHLGNDRTFAAEFRFNRHPEPVALGRDRLQENRAPALAFTLDNQLNRLVFWCKQVHR